MLVPLIETLPETIDDPLCDALDTVRDDRVPVAELRVDAVLDPVTLGMLDDPVCVPVAELWETICEETLPVCAVALCVED